MARLRGRRAASRLRAVQPGQPQAASARATPWSRTLRRRLRSACLAGLEWPLVPPAFVESALCAVAPLARSSGPLRRVRANLALVGASLGQIDHERLERRVARHAARQFATWVRLSRSDGPTGARGAWLEAQVRRDASAAPALVHLLAGRAGIVATAHLGDWEVLAAWLARMGARGGVIGLERPHDPTTAWLERLRAANGVRTWSHAAQPRELVELLRGGGCLGVLNDLDTPRSAQLELEFLGQPARSAKSPASLARLAGVSIWPLVCVVDGAGWAIHGAPAISVPSTAPKEDSIRRALLQLARVQEAWVRRWPDQWAWHQPRWRS